MNNLPFTADPPLVSESTLLCLFLFLGGSLLHDHRWVTFLLSKATELLAPGMPGGVVEVGERWVQSQPILIPGRRHPCFIRGKFDTIVKFDDHTYGVIDFKTCHRRDEHLPLYTRQLHAYCMALVRPRASSACHPLAGWDCWCGNRTHSRAQLTKPWHWRAVLHGWNFLLMFPASWSFCVRS